MIVVRDGGITGRTSIDLEPGIADPAHILEPVVFCIPHETAAPEYTPSVLLSES